MIVLLYLIFSVNCDSLNSEIYNLSRKLKEVEYCQCVDEETFSKIQNPKKFRKFEDECILIDLNLVEEKYKQLKRKY